MCSTHVKVWFRHRNFGVAPAGADTKNTGHHHLLIDAPVPHSISRYRVTATICTSVSARPKTVVELTPGTHTLQLLMGDADHVPHDPPLMSKRITIHVRAAGRAVIALRSSSLATLKPLAR